MAKAATENEKILIEVIRDDDVWEHLRGEVPSGRFPSEAIFAMIGLYTGWQPGEVRRDLKFRFTLYDVEYTVQVTTDDEEGS